MEETYGFNGGQSSTSGECESWKKDMASMEVNLLQVVNKYLRGGL